MISLPIKGFCKNEDCPSSNELLELQNGALAGSRCVEVRRHIESCEFCAAEAEFYRRYPQEEMTDERVELANIPAPLFQLAEALLKKKQNDPSSLDSLLMENGLVLDKV